MANFKTHITTSTVVGIGYGAYGATVTGVPLTSCVVAGGLCSLAGMLPDLDSDNGIPVRETFCFASAVIPVLMLDRFSMMGMSHEDIVLASSGMYFFVRFVIAWIFKRYTVHRGMWHSVPAAVICGILAYMICSCEHEIRMFKSIAVVMGFMSHLILDEIYSVDLRNRRIKKSFGTALKLFSNKWWPNVSTYGKLALLVVAATMGERQFVEYFREPANRFHYTATRVAEKAGEVVEGVLGHAEGVLGHSHGGDAHFTPASASSASNGSGGGATPPRSTTSQDPGPGQTPSYPANYPASANGGSVAPLYTSPAPSNTAPSNGAYPNQVRENSPGLLPLPNLPPPTGAPDSFGGPLFKRY